ncbi:hypothetical protein [Microbacterium sp. Gd 4-13]|uniref:hypothetical protein n=1 Tax=Microbacterium sp. Gd 4-13 TaxID=2173179 RepID=UPI001057889D|nr:hypothetical protein [Microbacterium sp. Gd 4-13]
MSLLEGQLAVSTAAQRRLARYIVRIVEHRVLGALDLAVDSEGLLPPVRVDLVKIGDHEPPTVHRNPADVLDFDGLRRLLHKWLDHVTRLIVVVVTVFEGKHRAEALSSKSVLLQL